MISSSTSISPDNGNISDKDYFRLAISKGTQVMSDETICKITGEPVFYIASPVMKDGNTIGVIVCSIQLKAVWQRITDPVKVGESGYAFVLNKNGEAIAYPDKTQIFKINAKNIPTIKAIMDKMDGFLFNTFKGTGKIYIFKAEKVKEWTIDINAPVNEVFETATIIRNRMTLYSFIILMALWIIIRTQTERIIMKPIKKLNERLKDISMGEADLTKRITDLTNDEVGELGKLFNLAEATREINQTIIAIQNSTNQASGQINNISKVIGDVNTIVTGIAAAVEEQSVTTSEIDSNVADVSKGIIDTSNKSSMVSDISSNITELMKEMANEAKDMAESSGMVSKSSTGLYELAGTLRTIVQSFKI